MHNGLLLVAHVKFSMSMVVMHAQVITVNQVVDILIKYQSCNDWKATLEAVLPVRKQAGHQKQQQRETENTQQQQQQPHQQQQGEEEQQQRQQQQGEEQGPEAKRLKLDDSSAGA